MKETHPLPLTTWISPSAGGKRVACMGANGSGKSTFFLCCNGILRPDSGRILFAGQPLDYSRKGLLSLRSQVGIVFQDPDNQLFCSNVFQEISFGPLNLGLDEATVRKRVSAVMDRLGITPLRGPAGPCSKRRPEEAGVHCGYPGDGAFPHPSG